MGDPGAGKDSTVISKSRQEGKETDTEFARTEESSNKDHDSHSTKGQPKQGKSLGEPRGTDEASPRPGNNEEGEGRKHVIRMTLTEAAEEIKRLRRLERRYNAEKKEAEQKLEQKDQRLSALQQEYEVTKKAHEDEITSLKATHEQQIKKKEKEIKELKEEVILMQETSLPLVEARKLTFKALRKGRALQCLANVCVTNSLLTSLKRHAMHAFLLNAFGEERVALKVSSQHGPHAYTEGHLRLLRQEQLILLAENERLVAQVQALQGAASLSRVDRMQNSVRLTASDSFPMVDRTHLDQASTSFKMKCDSVEKMPLREMSMLTASGAGDPSPSGVGIRELNAEVMKLRMQHALEKSSLEIKKDAMISGASLLECIFRSRRLVAGGRALWILAVNSRLAAASAERQREHDVVKQQLQEACEQLQQQGKTGGQQRRCRACHAWNVLSAELNQQPLISVPTKPQKLDVSTTLPVANLSHAWPSTLPVTGDLSGGSSALGGIPPAVAFAPYYFRDLPSAQRKNLYFASPPPPLEQQQLRSTTDRARDAALDRRVLYRPAPTVDSGWHAVTNNTNLEAPSPLVTLPASSQTAKERSAREALESTMGIPGSTPEANALSPVERRAAYLQAAQLEGSLQ